ncbi:DUF6571 family protein [Streptomyces spirodelae]|uniref:PPE domain-containing protein n=1 Tax=Streptomyces spirodelae TaxID=2812904 RepID=A0ABS3X1U6_9ACTN|nr:DUF6571 family protein [Streptomyces spirodelae]MBO8189303.1 hypothetical protein [Streptomyces spirodelae]
MSEHTLDYTTVRHVDLTPLREAVREWGKLPEDFMEVHTSFERTVSKPLTTHQSGWHGEAKDAAFKAFRSLQGQVTEAAGQARKMSIVMSEALNRIQQAKDDLKAVEDEVNAKPKDKDAKNYLLLNEKDGVVYIDPPASEDSPGLRKAYHETIADLNRRILTALTTASEADQALKTALLYDPEGEGFNDNIAGHLADLDKQARNDADALFKLAGDEDFKRDPKLISKVNGILARNSDNPYFAEEFATRKGAKGILEFWYRTAKPDYEDGPFMEPKKRPAGVDKQLAALQDNLSNTLALASRSTSPEMTQWKQDVIDLGYKRLPGETGPYMSEPPYGFQVMSNLMRTGKWDTQFLHDYGDKLVETDKKSFIGPGGREEDQGHRKWLSNGRAPNDFLNFGDANDNGADPFTGYMEALGHNAEASTDFFNDDDKFDYTLRERRWLPDGEPSGEGPDKGATGPRVALGHALASATTGHDWDAPLAHPPSHTKDQAHIMSELVKGVAEKDGIELAPGMHDGLGRAAAEYTPDFFRAMKDGSEDTKLFPMEGVQANFGDGEAHENDHMNVTRFLVKLGQDPDANAALTQAQKLYTAETLEHHLAGDLPAGQKYDASPKETVQEILRASGETSGTLAIGRQEAVVGAAVARDAQFESSTLSARLWGNTGFAAAVIPATVKWMSPVGGAALGTIVTGAESALAYDIDARISRSESIDKADIASQMYDRAQKRDIQQNEAVLEAIEKTHHVDTSNTWAEIYSKEGYNQAVTRVSRTAPFLDSLDQVKSLPVERPDS